MKTSPATARHQAALAKARNNMIARAMRRLTNANSMMSAKNRNKIKKLFGPKKKSPVKKTFLEKLFKYDLEATHQKAPGTPTSHVRRQSRDPENSRSQASLKKNQKI